MMALAVRTLLSMVVVLVAVRLAAVVRSRRWLVVAWVTRVVALGWWVFGAVCVCVWVG